MSFSSDAALVAEFYDANAAFEESRLIENKVEFAVSFQAISDGLKDIGHNADNPASVLDLGGGTGPYCTSIPEPISKLIEIQR